MTDLTQRDAFWGKICRLARRDRDIVVITSDMGAPALDEFRRDLGGQFLNVGIAEQNAITVGAGLALSGKKVFCYAIAPFITLRCLEQIRVECAIMNLPLAIVGVGAGFSYHESGPTHHLLEDIAALRSMPGLTIHSISDSVMASSIAELCCRKPAPRYVRMDRDVLPNLYRRGTDFSPGLSVLRRPGKACIVATGAMTHVALELAGRLARAGLTVGVIDLYRIPVNESLLARALGRAAAVISIEEHFLPGGLGGLLCEFIADRGLPLRVKRLGVERIRGYCYEYGGRDVIRRRYRLDIRAIERSTVGFLARIPHPRSPATG